jgi:hypothetical protein
MEARRLGDGPIIGPASDPSLGTNIQGPSLVRAPSWVDDPLGRYYLYFADHKGSYIRLAYADEVEGPWTVHRQGSLHLADSCFLTEAPPTTDADLAELAELYGALFGEGSFARTLASDAVTPHIASPEVHLDEAERRVVMYFHGLDGLGIQVSRAAVSSNGIDFAARPEVLGPPYLRAFRYDGWTYALTMPGRFLRSRDGLTTFESGPSRFGPTMRHAVERIRAGRGSPPGPPMGGSRRTGGAFGAERRPRPCQPGSGPGRVRRRGPPVPALRRRRRVGYRHRRARDGVSASVPEATARALVLEEPRRLVARDLPLPAIGADDGLLRVEACGLCGTDHEQSCDRCRAGRYRQCTSHGVLDTYGGDIDDDVGAATGGVPEC